MTTAISYESLADAALDAAIDLQKFIETEQRNFAKFESFVRLLQEPIGAEGQYKLLHDVRKLPLYRAAWVDVFGDSGLKLKSSVLLERLSKFLKNSIADIDKKTTKDLEQIVEFCLALNRAFVQQMPLAPKNTASVDYEPA